MSCDPRYQLIQFNSVGDEVMRVQLPDDMRPHHAVETATATFVVSRLNLQLNQHQIVEVNNVGEVLRQFSGQRLSSLGRTRHIAVDSRGNILVADCDNSCIMLLDSRLTLRRTIINKLNYKPWRLCYNEQSGQLLVGLLDRGGVAVFDVLCR